MRGVLLDLCALSTPAGAVSARWQEGACLNCVSAPDTLVICGRQGVVTHAAEQAEYSPCSSIEAGHFKLNAWR